jgi:hypothetical protein
MHIDFVCSKTRENGALQELVVIALLLSCVSTMLAIGI